MTYKKMKKTAKEGGKFTHKTWEDYEYIKWSKSFKEFTDDDKDFVYGMSKYKKGWKQL